MFTFSVALGIVLLHPMVGETIEYDLAKPTLYLNPPFGVFLNGEKVTLHCRCQCPVTRTHYYRGKVRINYTDTKAGMCETSLDFRADQGHGGKYTCSCLTAIGTWRQSNRSEPVQITILEKLPVPSISMTAVSRPLSNGENVEITCQGDTRSTEGILTLYSGNKGNSLMSHKVSAAQRSATFIINTRKKCTAGKYTCRYQTEILGRLLESEFSDAARFIVKAPSISMDPVSGTGSNGEKIHITCKGDIRSRGGIFFLYSGQKGIHVQSRNVSDPEKNETFTINTLNKDSGGNYRCRYQTEVGRCLVESPFSEDVRITVKGGYLTVGLVRLCLGALLLIVMVIILVEHFVNANSSEGLKALDKIGSPNRHNNQSWTEITLA